MGDRVLIVCTDSSGDVSPAVYSHWDGYEAPEMLVQAGEKGLIRRDDPSYAIARICAHFCASSSGCTGIGLMDKPANIETATLREYSHGDAGVIVVNVSDGSISYPVGYHGNPRDDDDPRGPVPVSLKLAA